MPYRDPHTAAPALWALRQLEGATFEVSVVEVQGSVPTRKGLEALAIAAHRQEHGQSPTVSFGRMPQGFRMSSPNNALLVSQGKRFRGGPAVGSLACHSPGVPPAGPLEGPVESPSWCGHRWSPWIPLEEVDARAGSLLDARGLYRIRGVGQQALLYVGEGNIANRLQVHAKKVLVAGHAQGVLFAAAERLECSWVAGSWLDHQRLELENDLIAAHVLLTGAPPAAQFLG
ncbi:MULTISPECIES: hypothetical protein [Corallococcus]|nr:MULTISPECIES: hypothetical protein [Corallococcus]